MSNMTPFEIRLELLKMARDMLNDDYYGKREQIAHPGYPLFPSEQEVINKALTLNGFVSNITTETKPVNKKSTT